MAAENWIYGNRYLSIDEMTPNAQRILQIFTDAGWNTLSICAMLGNMQVESTINPGLWGGRVVGSDSYGLVQWHPTTKLSSWAEGEGLEWENDGDTQCQRILYELATGLQWQSTSAHPISFEEFAYNTGDYDLQYLSDAWCYCYENPADPDLELRYQYSEYWYTNLTRPLPIWLLKRIIDRQRKRYLI